MAKRASGVRKPGPFDDDFRPYGTNAGPRGNPEQWKEAYEQRMGAQEAEAVLSGSGQTPYAILGLSPGASCDQIKKAYRRIVLAECQGAFGVAGTIDPVAEDRFKVVNAAYSSLMREFE